MLQFVYRAVDLLAERSTIELIERRFVEALADAVCLRTLGLVPQYSLPRSVTTCNSFTSYSSNNGRTLSMSRSAAVIGVLRSYSLYPASTGVIREKRGGPPQ
jgi:hypothetical protein